MNLWYVLTDSFMIAGVRGSMGARRASELSAET